MSATLYQPVGFDRMACIFRLSKVRVARDNQLLPLRTLRAGRDFLTGMRSTVSKVKQATKLSLDALSAFNLVSGRCGY